MASPTANGDRRPGDRALRWLRLLKLLLSVVLLTIAVWNHLAGAV